MMQIFMGLIVGGVTIVAFQQRINAEEELRTKSIRKGYKTSLIEPLMLPIIFVAILLTELLVMGGGQRIGATFVDWGLLFLNISIYYAALLLLLPLLRRIISAWACATLWLIPNLLYITINLTDYAMLPRVVVTVPHQLLSAFIWIWAIGFVSVVIWQIISHLSYRRFLLKEAEEFTDNTALSSWNNEAKRHGIKPEIPVLISEAVSTPITIGCFDRTMRLILPKQNYTAEDIQMVFSHELRHILRADTRTKMFIGFCAAICWFNPLSWIARRKASDDLELSCDEAVLVGADEKTRRQYAELLLKNAGNNRGYTTCLSASANSLRYRLRNVVKPAKRLSGSFVVGVTIFALFMTVGSVAVADSSSTVRAAIFGKTSLEISVKGISTYKWSEEQYSYCSVYGWNEEPLTQYISSLRVKQVYLGNYAYNHDDVRYLAVNYQEILDGEVVSLIRFVITDKLLIANIPYDDYGSITFLLEDEIDWSYLDTLLDFDVENPDPSPQPPEMLMYFDAGIDTDSIPMYAMRTIHSVFQNGESIRFSEHWNGSGIDDINDERLHHAGHKDYIMVKDLTGGN